MGMGQKLRRAGGRVLRTDRVRRMVTSLSDNDAYPQFCLDAASDYRRFQGFRRDPAYTKILEHVSKELGDEYLKIVAEDPSLAELLPRFAENDRVGGPLVHDYGAAGSFSPTTLRYAKVLGDLKRLFGSLDGMRIAEIGVGYGGQCRVLNAAYTPAEYRLIDLQPALALTGRYLDHFVLPGPVSYRTMNELCAERYDLVISNYAFTELPRGVQECYFDRVVRQSERGYITFNDITPESFNSYSLDELREKIGMATTEPEKPLTHPRNCVIHWGSAG